MKGLFRIVAPVGALAMNFLVMSACAQGKAPPPPVRTPLPPETRRELIGPAKPGELRLVPTFNSISVCYGSEKEIEGLKLEYRKKGERVKGERGKDETGEWRQAEFGCPWFEVSRNHRGSIYSLEEDTEYEVRVKGEMKTVRTWKTEVPIARTVEIDPATVKFPLVISERGSEGGWVRLAVKGGRLEAPQTARCCLLVTNACYVVIDDLTLRGGDGAVIRITESDFVRVRHCDIADWGMDGYRPVFDKLGALRQWDARRKRWGHGNHSGGIDLCKGVRGIVVERCYIHEPRSRAHAWRYSHPYGPMAIRLCDTGGNHVIRWNDLVGCDAHRFDDVIGGGVDFSELGTFNRDSDIYGNFMAFANDDCLEIDGGQQNVRVFGNRSEASYMGVSVQGCVVSPSYVFDNIFTGGNDEFDDLSASIKTAGIDVYRFHPRCYVFDNFFWGRGDAMNMAKNEARLDVRRNTCYGPYQAFAGLDRRSDYPTMGDNRTNLVVAACPAGDWPHRPIPYVLDTSRIDGVRLAKGAVSPRSARVTLTCGGTGYRQPFEVMMNDQTGWVKVSPARGTIESGKTIVFDLTFDAAKMDGVRMRRAAFLVRTADGFSRPVTVYGETDYEQPFACERPGEIAVYSPGQRTSSSVENSLHQPLIYSFDVPTDGRYYFLLRGRTAKGRRRVQYRMGVDDGELDKTPFVFNDWSAWMNVAPSGSHMGKIRYYDLKKGVHTLKLRKEKDDVVIEGVVLTDSPGSFEPERGKFAD